MVVACRAGVVDVLPGMVLVTPGLLLVVVLPLLVVTQTVGLCFLVVMVWEMQIVVFTKAVMAGFFSKVMVEGIKRFTVQEVRLQLSLVSLATCTLKISRCFIIKIKVSRIFIFNTKVSSTVVLVTGAFKTTKVDLLVMVLHLGVVVGRCNLIRVMEEAESGHNSVDMAVIVGVAGILWAEELPLIIRVVMVVAIHRDIITTLGRIKFRRLAWGFLW